MSKRRAHGDGGLYWSEKRQRWIAAASLGYDASGKRIVRRGSGRTKTEAKNKLKEVLRDYEDGLAIAPTGYTVENAVRDWLTFGLAGRDDKTVETATGLCRNHVIPPLGARKLRDLSAEDVDKWLAQKATTLSTRTLQGIHSCLNRAVRRAMTRDKVKRNVVELCQVPKGQPGRPSKALTFAQAEAVLSAASRTHMHAYIVVSLLTGARTEELRALTWDHVFLTGDTRPQIRPSRRTWPCGAQYGPGETPRLGSPDARSRCRLAVWRCCGSTGKTRAGTGLLLATAGRNTGSCSPRLLGRKQDASHVRRAFRVALSKAEGIDAAEWTPRELRHSFVSLLSDNGVPLEEISRLVGHSSTAVTEEVYRKQIRPVIQTGAVAMDRIFARDPKP